MISTNKPIQPAAGHFIRRCNSFSFIQVLLAFSLVLFIQGCLPSQKSSTAESTFQGGIATTPDSTYSSITGTSQISADGSTASTITITLKDSFSNPLPGVTPTFSATNTNSTNSYGTCSATNLSGISTCTLTSTYAETKILSLVSPIAMTGGSVVFVIAGISGPNSTLSATTPQTANGVAVSTVTATLKDGGNNALSGTTPTLSVTGSNNTVSCGSSNGAGVATCTISSTTAETKTITLSGVTSSPSTTTVFQAGAATKLVYSTAPSTSGTSTQTLSQQPVVQVQDANSNNVASAVAITLSAWTTSDCSTTSATGTLTVTTNPVTSGAGTGTATFAGVKYDRPGTIYIKAAGGALTSACSAAIALSNNAPSLTAPSNLVFPLDGGSPPILQEQSSTYTFTPTVSDVDGGQTVTLSCTYTTPGMDSNDPNYVGSATNCTSLPSLVTTGGVIKASTATFSTSTGVLTWWPTKTQRGTYKILLTADDGYSSNNTTTASYYLTVRENYNSTYLTGLFDAATSYDTGLSNKPIVPKGTSTGATNNNTDPWLGLTNSINGTLSSNMTTTTPWAGTGTSSSPYQLAFNGSSDKFALSSDPLSGQTKFSFNTWINPSSASSTAKVILTTGAETSSGSGFVLKQSDQQAGRLELQVGKGPVYSGQSGYSGLVMMDAPVSYWRLGEAAGVGTATALGSCGAGCNGTYTNSPTRAQSGAISTDTDTAVSFTGADSGTNQMVSVTTPASLNINAAVSVEAWIKPTSLPSSSATIIRCGVSTDTQYGLSIASDGSVVYTYYDGAFKTYSSAASAISTGAYQHVVLTRQSNGTTYSIYVNGTAVVSGASAGTTPSVAGAPSCNIGATTASTNQFTGSIDEVAVYSYALSYGQIKAHYDGGTGKFYANSILASQPVGYWPMNETSGNVAIDYASTAHNGTYGGTSYTLANSSGPFSSTDSLSKGAYLQTSAYMKVGNIAALDFTKTSTFSAEAWVYLTATPASNSVLLGKAKSAANFEGYWFYIDTSGRPRLDMYDSNANVKSRTANQALTNNAWHHVAFTYSGTNSATGITLYLDGSVCTYSSTSDTAYTADISNTGNFSVGASNAAVSFLSGTYANAAVFNFVLSAQEVSNHYNYGAPWKCLSQTSFSNGVWNMISGIWDGTALSLFVNGQKECSVTTGTTYGSPSTPTVAASSAGSNWWNGILSFLQIFGTTGGNTVASSTTVQGDFYSTANRFRSTTMPQIVTSNLILHLDAALAKDGMGIFSTGCSSSDPNKWFDLSVSGYNGTLTGFSSCTTDGWQGAGTAVNPYTMTFNGTSDAIDLGNLTAMDFGASSFTLEMWTNPNSATTWQVPMGKGHGGAATGWRAFITATGHPDLFWGTDANAYTAATGSVSASTWQHIVWGYNATAGQVFYAINGTYQAITTAQHNVSLSGNLKIGMDSSSAYKYAGSIAIVRIYNKALTSAEISQNCAAQVSRFNGVVCN